jgi:hypothetical protein
MTLTFASRLGRSRSTTARPAPDSRSEGEAPMKIEVESLPDYLWRELGFQQPRRPDAESWPR